MKDLDRREFTLRAALAMLGGATITVSGCGGGGGGGNPGGPSAGPGDEVASISDNHGHSAVVRGAQLSAGLGMTLNIQNTATHPHTVELSAAEVVAIRNGNRVSKSSSSGTDPSIGGHQHVVTFNAEGEPGPGY